MKKLILVIAAAALSTACVFEYQGRTYDCQSQLVNNQPTIVCQEMVFVSRESSK